MCICLQSATVTGNKILKMTSCSHLELFFHEFVTVQITQMKFGTDLHIIVIKGCAFGFICNYLENQHIQYGARQPSWIPKIKIVYIVVLLKVDCLPDAVGKQPSIPSINLERKWTLNWWWWWWCEYSNFSHHHTNIPTHQLNWNVIWLYISLYLAYRRVELHMLILDLG